MYQEWININIQIIIGKKKADAENLKSHKSITVALTKTNRFHYLIAFSFCALSRSVLVMLWCGALLLVLFCVNVKVCV